MQNTETSSPTEGCHTFYEEALMHIPDTELKTLIEAANKNNESPYDLLNKRYSHLDRQALEWAGVSLRRVIDASKGIQVKETLPPLVQQQEPMRATA